VGRLLSFPQAELLPIAVNAGQTVKPRTPEPVVPISDHLSETLQEAWFERITDRLLNAEMGELNPHCRDDYRQSRIIVSLCRAGDPTPLVSSSYRVYGVHPDLVFVAIQAIRKAKLGDEYSDVYDENGSLIPQRFDISDYDPFARRQSQKENDSVDWTIEVLTTIVNECKRDFSTVNPTLSWLLRFILSTSVTCL